MKKVIILRSVAEIEPRTQRTIKCLSEAGYSVTYLFLDRDRAFPKYKQFQGVDIISFKINWFKRSIGSVLVLPIWWIYILFKLLRQDCDYIHCIDLDTLPPAFLVAKIRGKKVVYEVFDSVPDVYPYSYGLPAIRPFIKKIDDILIPKVNGLIIADDIRYKQVGLDIIKKCKNVSVIYNSPSDSYTAAKNDNDIFTLFYGGSLAEDRGVLYLIDAIAGLPNVQLVIAGFGTLEREVEGLAKKISNVQYLGKVDHKTIIKNTEHAHLIPCLYDPNIPNNVFASPNKFFESLMLGKPSIAYRETLFSKRLETYNCGMVISHNQDVPSQIRRVVETLSSDSAMYSEMSRNARNLYVSDFSEISNKARLQEFYANV